MRSQYAAGEPLKIQNKKSSDIRIYFSWTEKFKSASYIHKVFQWKCEAEDILKSTFPEEESKLNAASFKLYFESVPVMRQLDDFLGWVVLSEVLFESEQFGDFLVAICPIEPVNSDAVQRQMQTRGVAEKNYEPFLKTLKIFMPETIKNVRTS